MYIYSGAGELEWVPAKRGPGGAVLEGWFPAERAGADAGPV